MRAAVVAVAALSSLVLVGAASAASPMQMYEDLVVHGRFTRAYSASDVARYKHDAILAGYHRNKVVTVTIKPKVQPKQVMKPPTKQKVQPPPKKAPRQVFTPPRRSALPFTGSELATFLALGFALVAGGLLLRMMTSDRSAFR